MTTNNDETRERGGMTEGEWDIMEGKTLLHIETRYDNPVGAGIHICSLPKASVANAKAIAGVPSMVEAIRQARLDLVDYSGNKHIDGVIVRLGEALKKAGVV